MIPFFKSNSKGVLQQQNIDPSIWTVTPTINMYISIIEIEIEIRDRDRKMK